MNGRRNKTPPSICKGDLIFTDGEGNYAVVELKFLNFSDTQ
jgi:hypothetical protein